MTQQDNRAALLQQVLDSVNNWLQFAEAKNAALIAFNVAVIGVILGSDLYEKSLLLSSFIVGGFVASTGVVLYAFWPVNKEIEKNRKDVAENLLHYAYIATLTSNEYLEKLAERYWGRMEGQEGESLQLERDYCREIVENARIIIRKQRCFKIGLAVVLVMLCLLVVSVISA